ncbi:hypothetical protein QUA71_27975 [Microcoleus sp. MON1_C5]|uniref:hypothetical protein n=1 Tax=Microcoleus sp. MON1_C5 TaxID=2818828 RepID=UPI002FD42AE3
MSVHSFNKYSLCSYSQLLNPRSPINFIALLVRLYPQRLGDILHQHCAFSPAMNLSEKLQKVDRLKAWLDSFRPLSPTRVAELKKLYDVRFSYHSNAIEGNTLTQRETELVLKSASL